MVISLRKTLAYILLLAVELESGHIVDTHRLTKNKDILKVEPIEFPD